MSKPKSPQTPASPSSTPAPSLPFEDALAQIERIIERIEAGEVGLEESLGEYERGVGLINHCRSKLSAARQQVEDLTRKLQQADEEGRGRADADSDEDADEDPDDTSNDGQDDEQEDE